MKTTELTQTIKLTELEISFIKLTLQNSKFEEGSKFSKNMIKTFEKLHIDLLKDIWNK
tara:strand:- start:11 stop:184 length:174 start_codon:yes stop_codon:yes gene_type:complete